jgi:hypothetical protein
VVVNTSTPANILKSLSILKKRQIMGIYIYTRRADHRIFNGIKVVRFDYAFKPLRGYDKNPLEQRLLAAGERAAVLTSDAHCFFMGDWKDISVGEPVAVYLANPSICYIVDDAPREVIGYLHRKNKRVIELEMTSDIDKSFELIEEYIPVGKTITK